MCKVEQRAEFRSRRELGGNGGFALVISLGLMSFVLLLLLILNSYLRMEAIQLSTLKETSQARQNAILGMGIALGELQAQLGPDMRVTATADITATENSPDAPLDGRRHWTGVWVGPGAGTVGDPIPPQATLDGEPFRRYQPPVFRRWLVSGLNDPTLLSATQSNDALADEVELLGGGRVLTSEDRVAVGRVALSPADDTGGFAYWVSDEGVKAKLNISGYNPLGLSSAGNRSFGAAPRHGIELLRDGSREDPNASRVPLGDWLNPWMPEVVEDFAKTLSAHNLPLIASDSEAAAKFIQDRFHDVSFYSMGVLADSYRGGLRKDLTLAFEMDFDDFNADVFLAGSGDGASTAVGLDHPVNFLFQWRNFGESLPMGERTYSGVDPMPDRAGTPATIHGPTWHLLRNHYRLYKANDPDRAQYESGRAAQGVHFSDGSPLIVAHGTLPMNLSLPPALAENYRSGNFDPFSTTYASHHTRSSNDPMYRPILMGVVPVPVRTQLILSLSSKWINQDEVDADPSVERVYRLVMHIDPVLVLWNPYNVRMRINQVRFTWGWPKLSGVLTATDPDGDVTTFDISMVGAGRVEEGREVLDDRSGGMNIQLGVSRTGEGHFSNNYFFLEPGEAKLYSAAHSDALEHRTWGAGDTVTYLLWGREGFDDMRDASGLEFDRIHIHNSSADPIDLTEGTEISVEVSASNESRSVVAHMDILTSGIGNQGRVWQGDFHFNDQADFYTNSTFEWPGPGDFLYIEELDNVETPAPIKTPVAVVDIALKAEDAEFPVPLYTQFSPRATQVINYTRNLGIYDLPEHAPGVSVNTSDNYHPRMWRATNWDQLYTEAIIMNPSTNQSPVGPSNRVGENYNVTLFDLPMEPLLSVTELRHAQTGIVSQQPTYMVGESWANAFIPKTSLVNFHYQATNPSHRHRSLVDWNYMMNDALYDGYFFSGVAPDGGRGIETVLNDFLDGRETLLNPRLRLVPGMNEQAEEWVDDSGVVRPNAYRESAAGLLIDGAFNVNSTSVEAWAALIASLNDISVGQIGGGTQSNVDSPFSRLRQPSAFGGEEWNGFVSLSSAQVRALAENIVEEVKARGPFVSLADFVNRRLTDDDTAEMGALQAALEATSGLQNHFIEQMDSSDLAHVHPDVPNAASLLGRKIAAAAPGYLTQGDLLTPLAPILAARSDTFVIRVYGDRKSPLETDASTRVWGEVVVQRMPEYVDPTANDPWDAVSDLEEGGLNRKFGRKFEILSFRWLDMDEVL